MSNIKRTVEVDGKTYFLLPRERPADARARVERIHKQQAAVQGLMVLRERAKKPYWVQHERGRHRVTVIPDTGNFKKARKIYDGAVQDSRTTFAFLFQHGIDRTYILDQYRSTPGPAFNETDITP